MDRKSTFGWLEGICYVGIALGLLYFLWWYLSFHAQIKHGILY
ncbi:hypothetical protein [Spirosoma sp. KNUC1025]